MIAPDARSNGIAGQGIEHQFDSVASWDRGRRHEPTWRRGRHPAARLGQATGWPLDAACRQGCPTATGTSRRYVVAYATTLLGLRLCGSSWPLAWAAASVEPRTKGLARVRCDRGGRHRWAGHPNAVGGRGASPPRCLTSLPAAVLEVYALPYPESAVPEHHAGEAIGDGRKYEQAWLSVADHAVRDGVAPGDPMSRRTLPADMLHISLIIEAGGRPSSSTMQQPGSSHGLSIEFGMSRTANLEHRWYLQHQLAFTHGTCSWPLWSAKTTLTMGSPGGGLHAAASVGPFALEDRIERGVNWTVGRHHTFDGSTRGDACDGRRRTQVRRGCAAWRVARHRRAAHS